MRCEYSHDGVRNLLPQPQLIYQVKTQLCHRRPNASHAARVHARCAHFAFLGDI